MARKPKFGSNASSYSDFIRQTIGQMQATGETAAATGGAVESKNVRVTATKDYKNTAGYQEMMKKRKAFLSNTTPYTDEEIAKDPVLSAIKGGITYEQALANLRKLTQVSNMARVAGQPYTKEEEFRYQKAYNALTPAQRNATRIFTLLGGSTLNLEGTGGLGGPSQAIRETYLTRLGINPSSMPSYSPVRYSTDKNYDVRLENPLNSRQRSKLQRLRSIPSRSLNDRQKAALARLVQRKNKPTVLP